MGEWVNVVSSNIASVKYDEEIGMMIVRFMKGDEYEYDDVYIEDYHSLIYAASVGSYFNTYIKSKYRGRKTY